MTIDENPRPNYQGLLDLSRLQEIIDLNVDEPLPLSTLQEWKFIPSASANATANIPPELQYRLHCQCCQYSHIPSLLIWRPGPLSLLLISHNEIESSSLVPLASSVRDTMQILSPESLNDWFRSDRPVAPLLPHALIGTITLCQVCYSHITRLSPLAAGRHPVAIAKKHVHNKRVADAIIEYLNKCNEQRVMPTFEAIAQYVHTRGLTTMTGKAFSSATIYKLMKESGITRSAYCRVYEWGRSNPTTDPTNGSNQVPTTTSVAETGIALPMPALTPPTAEIPWPVENRWTTEDEEEL